MSDVGTRPPVAELIAGLAERIGRAELVRVCIALLAGAPREGYVDELRALSGHAGDRVLDEQAWPAHWVRSWGARGLLHVWDDAATAAVVAGLGDEHDRPAEMCLKVTARHEVAGAGDGAAALVEHELPRVRGHAVRALGVVGDTEHVDAVRSRLDDADQHVRRQAARALERLARRLDLDA